MKIQNPLDFDPRWVIGDATHVDAPAIGGVMGHGYIERMLDVQPVYGASPLEIKTYPREDWPAMLEEQLAKQASLWHIRNRCGPNGGPMPYLIQGRYGYCWAHSATHALMLQLFGVQHQPFVPLSAFSVAAVIKNGRNEGAWAALAFEWMMANGCCPQHLWPQGNASTKLWTPEAKIEAAKFKVAEGWWDAGKHPGLRKLTVDQLFTLLYDCVPCPIEFSWWAHSVLGLRFVDRKDRSDPKDIYRYAIDFLNSHQGYGDNGVGRVVDKRMPPDSSVGLTSGTAG